MGPILGDREAGKRESTLPFNFLAKGNKWESTCLGHHATVF